MKLLKKPTFLLLAIIFITLPWIQAKAQSTEPFGVITGDQHNANSSQPFSESESEAAELDLYLNSLSGEIEKEESMAKAFGRLKLKPSDTKRLIKLFNGSLTEKEQASVVYDAKLRELLFRLVMPTELGGGGLTHLRVGDLLRFRQDPRSRETENADNISAHQFGMAADILEINKAHCTVDGGLFGSDKDLPPFPVKVAWQGGAPYSPNAATLGSFDAVARANAMRDILGAIPGESYNGSIQGLEDLLQQLQRRVLAIEAGLPSTSLDYLSNNDVLETLGRVSILKEFNYPVGALSDGTPESIPRSYLEEAWQLPPGSLKSGTDGSWNSALETLGRTVMAHEANVNPEDVLKGVIKDLKDSPYFKIYQQVDEAYNIPEGTIAGVQDNQPQAFRQVGASIIADRLHYSNDEKTALIAQAKNNAVSQFSLARVGQTLNVPFPVLSLLAPAPGTTKSQAEKQLSNFILESVNDSSVANLPPYLQDIIKKYTPLTKRVQTREQLTEFLASSNNRSNVFRQAGAAQMEEIFDLPESSFSLAVAQSNPPALESFTVILGQRLLEDAAGAATGAYAKRISLFANADTLARIEDALSVPKGTIAKHRGQPDTLKKMIGERYLKTDFVDTFNSLYRITSVGLNTLSVDDMYGLMTGKINDVSVRAGASWVEEDLGMVPDSFSVLFANGSTIDRLVSAGTSVLAGELFRAFGVDARNIQNGSDFLLALGRARVETLLGLEPGSFRTSLQAIKDANSDRFDTIFVSAKNQAEKARTVDLLIGATAGSTDAFLHGTLTPDALASSVGNNGIDRLDTENLQDKLGWDSRFLINGQELLAAIQGQSFGRSGGAFGIGGGGSVPNIREILSKIGAFNSDVVFGYDPGTMRSWSNADSQITKNNLILEQGSKLYASRMGLSLSKQSNLLASYKDGTPGAVQDVITSFEKRLRDIGADVKVPRSDVLSIVQGNMPGVDATMATVARAQRTTIDLKNKYETIRTILRGSSTDPQFEATISQESAQRYQEVLKEAGVLKDDTVIDRTLDTITKGVLSPTGDFNPNASPYTDLVRQEIERDYWGGKEARNDYFYGILDAQMKKQIPGLPADFSEDLLEGTLKDRSSAIFRFVGSQASTGILNSLPPELQAAAQAWLSSQDPAQGKVLSANPVFTDWMGTTFAKYTEGAIPASAIKLAMQYVSGTISADVIKENPSELYFLARDTLGAGWINKQIGLPVGQFQEIYSNYKEAQGLVADYKDGTLDPASAVAQVDQLVFGGALSGVADSIGGAFGLPPGVSVPLIQFAVTGNPAYLIQAIIATGILDGIFGGQVSCPDLQVEAKNNIKKLVEAVLDIAEQDVTLRPNQIITLDSGYIKALQERINKFYGHCEGARCGVFSRPEYAKQVHIGF